MNKKFYFNYIIILSCIIFALCLLYPYTVSTSEVLSRTQFSSVIIHVKDNHADKPINNATICVLNTRQYYHTNKNGNTDNIQIPLFDEYKKDDYYIYNLLVYKSGYNDYIYYGLKVKPSQKRADISIPLIPIINYQDIETTIYFEPPYPKSIDTIIKENKKALAKIE